MNCDPPPSSGFCVIDTTKPLHSLNETFVEPSEKQRGTKLHRNKKPDTSWTPKNLRMVQLVEPCLYMSFISDDAVVLVERPWSEVLETFPPPLRKHKYGT